MSLSLQRHVPAVLEVGLVPPVPAYCWFVGCQSVRKPQSSPWVESGTGLRRAKKPKKAFLQWETAWKHIVDLCPTQWGILGHCCKTRIPRITSSNEVHGRRKRRQFVRFKGLRPYLHTFLQSSSCICIISFMANPVVFNTKQPKALEHRGMARQRLPDVTRWGCDMRLPYSPSPGAAPQPVCGTGPTVLCMQRSSAIFLLISALWRGAPAPSTTNGHNAAWTMTIVQSTLMFSLLFSRKCFALVN